MDAPPPKPLLPVWLSLTLFGVGTLACALAAVLFFAKPVQAPATPGLPPLPTSAEEIAKVGAALVKQHNCNYCHRTDPAVPPEHPRIDCQNCHQNKSVPDHLAPPLDQVASQHSSDWLRRYLRYPYPIRLNSPDRMPDLGLTDYEVEVLATHLARAGFKEPTPEAPKPTVSYSQVQEVLNTRCKSCHYGPHADATSTMDPAGGAGWQAIWGKYPRHLSVESYEDVMRGSLDDYGRARAVVVPFAENSPLLMHVKGLKGPRMPFGRDALPESEIKLIETWIREGANK